MNLTSHPHSQRIRALVDRLAGRSDIRILFICLGNICRSPAANALMLEQIASRPGCRIAEVDSAGIGSWHVGDLPDRRMRVHGRMRGLDINHVCRQIRRADFSNFDLIIGMDDANMDDLRSLAATPEEEAKVYAMAEFFTPGAVWDCVPDPYYGGDQGFENVLDLLDDATRNIADTLCSNG